MTCSNRPLLTLLLSASLFAAACGDSDDGADATAGDGGTSSMDASGNLDARVLPDAGPTPDAGDRTDSGPRDGGYFCVESGNVSVDGTNVAVASTATPPTTPQGTPSVTSCIDDRPTQVIGAPIRFQGCVNVLGATATQAEIDELQVQVFNAADAQGNAVDPTYSSTTGVDHAVPMNITGALEMVPATTCASRWRIEVGRNATGLSQMLTDTPYIVRIRSSTTTAAPVWLDTYHFNVMVRSDNLEAGSTSVDRCTPQMCSGRVSLVLAKRSGLTAILNGAGIAGAPNFDDHIGDAYALTQTHDCLDLPMSNATAGFTPVPTAISYLSSTFTHMAGATATTEAGIALGLGFTGTSTVYTAVAITRDGTCTESFGGSVIRVYPDAISVVHSGRETTLH